MTWMLITSGRGPGECQVAVGGLAAALCAEARGLGLEAEVIETEDGPHGPLSALVALRGELGVASEVARSWEGTVEWVCPSPIRRAWPRKRWFVGVSRLSPPAVGDRTIREADLRFEAMRASGPGGQHVNKTESAVRLTHLPTGAVVVAREERSQHRNRALALARLADVLEGRGREDAARSERERWMRHDDMERGNPVRSYAGPDFRRTR